MRTISLKFELNITEPLKKGTVELIGSTGLRYKHPALDVPGYGWVPCSSKLVNNFSNMPEDLMLVVSDAEDKNVPVTSEIWVTRTNIVGIISL